MYIEVTITTINNLEQRFPNSRDPKVCVIMLYIWYVTESFEIGIGKHLFFFFNKFIRNLEMPSHCKKYFIKETGYMALL